MILISKMQYSCVFIRTVYFNTRQKQLDFQIYLFFGNIFSVCQKCCYSVLSVHSLIIFEDNL